MNTTIAGSVLCALCVASLARAESQATVTAPKAELIQRLRPEFDNSLPKNIGCHSLQLAGDYLYGVGKGGIQYFKREPQTGKLSYVGVVPWSMEQSSIQSFCAAGGHLYATMPPHWHQPPATNCFHGVVWYDIEAATGRPVEKGRVPCNENGTEPSGGMLASPDGRSLYVNTWRGGNAVIACFKVEADGRPVFIGETNGACSRMTPDGKHLYRMGVKDIACYERKPNGEIVQKQAFPLEKIAPGPWEWYYAQDKQIAGISPDGNWLYVLLFRDFEYHGELKDWYNDEHRKSYFAIFKRDPETGDLTLQEAGSSHDTTREDFKLGSYRGLNLIFAPDGNGGFINSGEVLQTFRLDPNTGRLSDISDVVMGGTGDSYCEPHEVIFDSKSGFLYGTGIWCNGGYEDYKTEVWAAKTGTALVRKGGRLDIKATCAATDAKGTNTQDWPCWRGATGDGKSPLKGIRKDWTGGLKEVWRVSGLSPARSTWSAPVVQGDKLIVVGKHGYLDEVFCFDADKGGAPLWVAELQGGSGHDGWCGGPTATPAIGGDKVILNQSGKYICLNLADGKVIWKIACFSGGHGPGHSPLAWEDLVVLPNVSMPDTNKGIQLVAFKKDSGAFAWGYETGLDCGGYMSPLFLKIDGKDQIVYSANAFACGLDPRTGKPIWKYEPDTKSVSGGGLVCHAPLTDGATVVVTTVFRAPQYAKVEHVCHPDGLKVENGVAKPVWNGDYGVMWGDGILKNGYIYTFSGDGLYCSGNSTFRCVDVKTGTSKWIQERTGCGNVIEVDGNLICLTYTGDLWLVDPSPDGLKKVTEWKGAIPQQPWRSMGAKDLKNPAPCWTTPVVARGKIYLRYSDSMACYDLTK